MMKNLIKKILHEDMGIRIDRLQSLQPKNYLIQSLKDKEKFLKSKTKSDEMIDPLLNEYDFTYETLNEDLTHLSYKDIDFTYRDGFFYVELPKYIDNKFNKLSKLRKRIQKLSDKYGNKSINLENLQPTILLNDWEKYFNDDGVYFYLDPVNRTHFPAGLPNSFKGYNLGYKMYRKLLDRLTYISSSYDASYAVQNIYRSLLKESDINCVITKESVVLMLKSLPLDVKKGIIYDFMRNHYKDFRVKKPYKINKHVVLDSDLLKTIGVPSIKEILEKSLNGPIRNYKLRVLGR